MDQITKQVTRARRRLNLHQFVFIASWALFGSFVLAAIAFAVRIFWGYGTTAEMQYFAWGAAGAGLVVASIIAYMQRRDTMEAALEIDRRFKLKERISSSLSLTETDRETEAGQALVDDAVRRAERIEVAEEFKMQGSPQLALPLLGIAIFALTLLVPNPTAKKAVAAEKKRALQEQIVKPAVNLKKKVEKRKKEAMQKGLKDASDLLEKVSDELDKVAGGKVEKRDALVKLNDLSQEIEKRRKELGNAENMRKKLQGMKNLKPGPADKMGKAMEQGDFKAAKEAMEDLKDKLADGQLGDEEKKAFADQLQQMKDKIQEMNAEREQKQQELREQIEQRRQAGDYEGAEQLQQELDKLNEQQSGMDQMMEMADKLGEAAENLQSGESDLAMQNLDDLLDQIQSMQDELDELMELNDLMDDLDGAKMQMSGQYGNGPSGNMPGMGMGDGQGQGERPEEESDTGFFNSQVRGDVQKGAAIKTGTADGPNRKGRSREAIKDEIQMSISERADAVNDQKKLPKDQREHLRDYFRMFTDE